VLIYEESTVSIGGCGGVVRNQDGPLYCSETQTIYYPYPWTVGDTGVELEEHGDFAVAAVMAHEFAHHVQGQLGLVKNWNVYSIQMELQAGCLAGVWATTIYYEGRLESGTSRRPCSSRAISATSRGHRATTLAPTAPTNRESTRSGPACRAVMPASARSTSRDVSARPSA